MSRGQDIWSDKGRGDFETEIVYKATTKSGDVCCFGNKVLASAWAGRGTVEPISVKTKTCEIAYPSEKMVQSIRLVADNSADEIESLRQQLADALAAIKVKDEALKDENEYQCDNYDEPNHNLAKALAIQPDDSALQAFAEKVREQAASIIESQDVDPSFKHRMASSIRNLKELPK